MANVAKPIAIVVRRGNDDKQMTLTPGAIDEIEYRVVEVASPTADQKKIREAWLTVPAGVASATAATH